MIRLFVVVVALLLAVPALAAPGDVRRFPAQGAATAAYIADSRKLLARVGGTGFPTLALEQQGAYALLEPSRYLGRPAQWQAHLRERIQGRA